VQLANPLVLASGIWGTSPALLERAARSGAGAVTAKTCTLTARRGHRNPTAIDWGHGMLNAMGLPNPGAEEEAALLEEAAARLAPLGVPLIASISADTAEGFAQAARIVARARPALIEVNISCPNVQSEHGEMFASSAEAAAEVTRRVTAAVDIPCIVKLSPNVPDIAAIARAVAKAGAAGITAINTMPGMLVDAESGAPVLDNRTGGISGPALKPIALRCVHEIAGALDIPVIGTGGVLTGLDAVEMISAGAACVGVGSAVFYRGENAFTLIRDELALWLTERGQTLDGIRGRTRCARDASRSTNPPPVPGDSRTGGGSAGRETRHDR
jgi:dihydroorotate dehydrogenase (NAD+) catalytic subunit